MVEVHPQSSKDSRRQLDIFRALPRINRTLSRIKKYQPNISKHLRQSSEVFIRFTKITEEFGRFTEKIVEDHSKLAGHFRTLLEVLKYLEYQAYCSLPKGPVIRAVFC